VPSSNKICPNKLAKVTTATILIRQAYCGVFMAYVTDDEKAQLIRVLFSSQNQAALLTAKLQNLAILDCITNSYGADITCSLALKKQCENWVNHEVKNCCIDESLAVIENNTGYSYLELLNLIQTKINLTWDNLYQILHEKISASENEKDILSRGLKNEKNTVLLSLEDKLKKFVMLANLALIPYRYHEKNGIENLAHDLNMLYIECQNQDSIDKQIEPLCLEYENKLVAFFTSAHSSHIAKDLHLHLLKHAIQANNSIQETGRNLPLKFVKKLVEHNHSLFKKFYLFMANLEYITHQGHHSSPNNEIHNIISQTINQSIQKACQQLHSLEINLYRIANDVMATLNGCIAVLKQHEQNNRSFTSSLFKSENTLAKDLQALIKEYNEFYTIESHAVPILKKSQQIMLVNVEEKTLLRDIIVQQARLGKK
jgi:hypothetical protein